MKVSGSLAMKRRRKNWSTCHNVEIGKKNAQMQSEGPNLLKLVVTSDLCWSFKMHLTREHVSQTGPLRALTLPTLQQQLQRSYWSSYKQSTRNLAAAQNLLNALGIHVNRRMRIDVRISLSWSWVQPETMNISLRPSCSHLSL